jgi:hypothetical protein
VTLPGLIFGANVLQDCNGDGSANLRINDGRNLTGKVSRPRCHRNSRSSLFYGAGFSAPGYRDFFDVSRIDVRKRSLIALFCLS